jgi:hypothetical protein
VDQSTPAVEISVPGDVATLMSDVTMNLATAGYFDTVGIPIVRGRMFSTAETNSTADVAIVNESLARRLWPEGDALDRALHLRSENRTVRVVGVARDAKYRTLTESSAPHLYLPTPAALNLTLLARTRDDPRQALRALQRELDGVGPGVVGFFPRTFDDHVAVQLLPTRAAANVASALGILALLLSAAALYALVAWFVALRRREIGVRVALGASARDVRRLVMRQAFAAAWPGIGAGVVLAIGLAMVARSALFGVGPADPIALALGVGSLLIIVLVAGYVPSRAATRVHPAQALRQ